jgi:hypothetical protein
MLEVEPAELPVVIAAEGVVPALVARVVDGLGDLRGALRGEERFVVGGPRWVHLFRHPDLQGGRSLTA